MTIIVRWLCFLVLCFSGCSTQELPDYWLCQGRSRQDVRATTGDLIESYTGQLPLILEKFQNSVFEFSAPVIFGLFVVCNEDSGELIFRDAHCSRNRASREFREGRLNLDDGTLHYTDRRQLAGKTVTTVADYQCRYLGHTYSFKDMEVEDAH